MEKSTLGISISLLGAGLYFISLISIIPLVIMAGYVLLFEQNEWLRTAAVKAVAIVVFFSVLTTLIGLLSNSSSLLNDLVVLFTGSIDLSIVNRILSIFRAALSILQNILLLMLGFSALKQGNVSFGTLENTIKKHM
jgi:hypothetical protein